MCYLIGHLWSVRTIYHKGYVIVDLMSPVIIIFLSLESIQIIKHSLFVCVFQYCDE